MLSFLRLTVIYSLKFLFNIIFPVIILGGICIAIFCGSIEVEVFQQLVPSQYNHILIASIFGAETLKCTLIFLGQVYKDNPQYSFPKLRMLLISTSLFCTMAFCFYNLHNPNQDNVRAEKVQTLRTSYDMDVTHINRGFDKEVDDTRSYFNTLINEQVALREKEKENTFKSSKEFKGPRYDAYQEEIERLEAEMADQIKSIENRRQGKLSALSLVLKTDIRDVEKEVKSTKISGSKTLLAILSIIHLNQDYPESHYIVLVSFFSLLLTVLLESAIYATFTILAAQYGDEFLLQQDQFHFKSTQSSTHETIKNDLKEMAEIKLRILDELIKQYTAKVQKLADTISKNIKSRIL